MNNAGRVSQSALMVFVFLARSVFFSQALVASLSLVDVDKGL